MPLFLVMIGGAFGSGLRYLVSRLSLALVGPGLPWGTWFINLAGDRGPSAYTIIFGSPDHGETPIDYVWTSKR